MRSETVQTTGARDDGVLEICGMCFRLAGTCPLSSVVQFWLAVWSLLLSNLR